MPAVAVERQIGSVLAGKYRLIRVLGRGGMGVVFEAEHTMTRRRVAVKVLHAHHKETGDASRRFINEAQAAGRIQHPNVVEVLDAGEDGDGSLYLVLELLAGQDLATLLMKKRRLEVAETVTIVAQVLQALVTAHQLGIIHRDIKPENIYLTRSVTAETHVKILDFGISKAIGGSDPGPGLNVTQTNTTVGTPHYMSPEQARGERTIDGRADLWAVAVVTYECLAGRVPFDGETYNDQIVKVITEPHVSLSNYDVPFELAGIVDRALEKDRANRYARASDMLADVRAFIESHPEYASVPQHYLREPAPPAAASHAPVAPPSAPTVETSLDPAFEHLHAPSSDTAPNRGAVNSSLYDTGVDDVPTVVRPYPEDPRPTPIFPQPPMPHIGPPMPAPVAAPMHDPDEIPLDERRRRVLLAASALFAAVCIGTLIAVVTHKRSTESASASAASVPSTVTVRFTGAPSNAQLVVNGVTEPRPDVAVLARGTHTVVAAVRAPGFTPTELSFVPDHDQTLALTLSPLLVLPPPAPAPATPDADMQFEPTDAPPSPTAQHHATAAAHPAPASNTNAAHGGGYLTVNASPPCTLAVDGQIRGHTPITHLGLPAGPHRILCRTSTGAIRSRTANVTAGRDTLVRFAQ